jgi:hypothetical protein
MIEVELPDTEGVPELVRSFAACLASVTETPVTDVAQPDADLHGAIAHWRSWLAGRGAGLVHIANPAWFNWPGYWLAILGDAGTVGITDGATAVLMFGTPALRCSAQPARSRPPGSGSSRPASASGLCSVQPGPGLYRAPHPAAPAARRGRGDRAGRSRHGANAPGRPSARPGWTRARRRPLRRQVRNVHPPTTTPPAATI